MRNWTFACAVAGATLSFVGVAGAQSQEQAEKMTAMFTKADADKDGALSAAEWKAAGRKERGFAMADTDKDGKVTPAELKALAAKYGR